MDAIGLLVTTFPTFFSWFEENVMTAAAWICGATLVVGASITGLAFAPAGGTKNR